MLNSPIDEIKNKLDIVGVIGSYIKLQKAGANYRALCPFHSEKKPSFFVSPARQIWHCFGCGRGGSIFNFIMEIEGVEFGDALRILAQKAGVELKKQDPKLKTERKQIYDISELACRFFEKQLSASAAGQKAKNYLLGRGISEESIKKWRIGYSPDKWRGLLDFLISKGFKKEEVEKSGLAIKNQDGKFYDRFRGRIMFPIFDLNSQVVGFGGRVFSSAKRPDGTDEAKYINTPSTFLYDKSRILYGLDKAKMAIRKKDTCILVEGYTDVIMASQLGYENVVATSGTALTQYQLQILKRYSENLLIAYDMDIAGDTATKRGISLAQLQGFNIKIITFPDETDPADIIAKDPKEWEKRVSGAKSILEFYFETTFSKFNKETPEGKKEISKIILPVIKRIPNKIEQSYWIQELARRLEIKEEFVNEELKKVKLDTQEQNPPVYEIPPAISIPAQPLKSRKELLEEKICVHIFRSPDNFRYLSEGDFDFLSPKVCQVLSNFKNNQINKENFNNKIDQIQATFSSEIASFFNYLLLKSEVEEFEEEDKEVEFQACLKEFRILGIKNKLDSIAKEIKKAEEEKDSQKINQMIEAFNQLSRELNRI
jgi:DNA primase